MNKIDSIILGDNQFFGVNHMSQDKGQETYERFKDLTEIKKTMYYALDNGVTGIMFSTHPSIYQITDIIRADSALKNNFSIYVNVPYIIKYVRMVSEMGAYNTVKTVLKGQTVIDKFKYILKSSYNAITNDYLGITNRLVDAEMNPFYDLNVKSIFLHNTLCDLALGYDMVKVIKNFNNYIKKKYNVLPAFGTLNLPKFTSLLEKADIKDSLIMTAINKKGFLMNPNVKAYERTLDDTSHTILAMATLASGRLHPEEAYDYLFSLNNVKHVIVGLSSKKHADETFKILHKYIS